METEQALYPEIEPYHSDNLRVSNVHRIYFEESGNPNGIPVLFVHGGPGGATSPLDRQYFDPSTYRIVLFDQRGCGNSDPQASLHDNTLPHLISDMEQLRRRLNVESWMLFGGSWGSALSLAYAETHPERVNALVLYGICTGRRSELAWFFRGGAAQLFPDAWEEFVDIIPDSERNDIISAFYRRLTATDPALRRAAAEAWTKWEARICTVYPDPGKIETFTTPVSAEAMARIECHYWMHDGFLDYDDQILRGIDNIRHIPATIVQGRHDVVCPMRTAWDLHTVWAEAGFEIVPGGGHAPDEPAMAEALVRATDDMRETLAA